MSTPPRGSNISFGTDGWRSYIAGDFTYDNVALVGAAIVRYLDEEGLGGKPLLVGYDRRFAAELFGAHIATTMRALGQPVLLFESALPTPAVAYAVQHLDAAGAVMLTASHNPHMWQGLKFIPYFAGPAMPETTDRITVLIRDLGPQFTPPPLALKWDGETLAIKTEYFAALDRLVNEELFRGKGLRVLYTAMHGCGAGWLDDFLRQAGVEVESIATARDPYFGGSLPDPSPANLVPLAGRAKAGAFNIVAGTDGDADRFGLVDPDGNYFSANHALPLLADYLIRAKGRTGPIARTVGTSELVDGIAKEHGLPLIETKVGFKYLGDELRKGALIAAEESGGISIQGHIPEKDGILATLLMLEMMVDTGNTLQQLLLDTMDRIGHRYYKRVDLVMADEAKVRLLTALKAEGFDTIAGHQIVEKKTLDGVKLNFADGCWAMIRPSGTEPVVRVYMEAPSTTELDDMATAIEAEIGLLAGQAVHRAGH
jgi:phosphomannomutase